LMTHDVNAAIEGAFDAGATEVVVNDSHWSMLNIIYEDLDPRAEIIRGFNKDLCMMEQIDQQFDAAFLVGYHAKVGHSHGVANETMFGPEMYEMRMNGVPTGEMEISAAVAGHYGVPIVMISGDDMFAKEAKASLGNIETAVVKYAIDRFSARCLSLPKSRQVIKDSAYNAVKRIKEIKPYVVNGPVELEVEWTSTAECRRAGLVPGSYFKSPRIVAYKGDTILEAWRGIFACLLLGMGATDHIYG
jgi:D-amino peptidase